MPIPIRGPLALPLRMMGVKISRMNPNLCNICETMFTRVKRRKQIVVTSTVLFADLRGYTALSQEAASSEMLDILHGFTDECAEAVWARDGIVNKFIGDAMLAIFNFPIMRDDHVEQAVRAAQDIQRRWLRRSGQASAGAVPSPGLGIGIHTGTASIGEIGTAYKDFTIIGPMVNMASRIQAAAAAGDILVSSAVYAQVPHLFSGPHAAEFALKGIERPTTLHRMIA